MCEYNSGFDTCAAFDQETRYTVNVLQGDNNSTHTAYRGVYIRVCYEENQYDLVDLADEEKQWWNYTTCRKMPELCPNLETDLTNIHLEASHAYTFEPRRMSSYMFQPDQTSHHCYVSNMQGYYTFDMKQDPDVSLNMSELKGRKIKL